MRPVVTLLSALALLLVAPLASAAPPLPSCTSDAECQASWRCLQAECVPADVECLDDGDCGGGWCVSGECAATDVTCLDDGDCGDGWCQGGACVAGGGQGAGAGTTVDKDTDDTGDTVGGTNVDKKRAEYREKYLGCAGGGGSGSGPAGLVALALLGLLGLRRRLA